MFQTVLGAKNFPALQNTLSTDGFANSDHIFSAKDGPFLAPKRCLEPPSPKEFDSILQNAFGAKNIEHCPIH
jgi:hypothetical protein